MPFATVAATKSSCRYPEQTLFHWANIIAYRNAHEIASLVQAGKPHKKGHSGIIIFLVVDAATENHRDYLWEDMYTTLNYRGRAVARAGLICSPIQCADDDLSIMNTSSRQT